MRKQYFAVFAYFILLTHHLTAIYVVTTEKVEIKCDVNYMNVSIATDDSKGVSVLSYYEDYMQDIKANFMLHVMIKKFQVDRWVPFLVNVKVNFCEFLKTQKSHPFYAQMYQGMQTHGILPQSCPIKKGSYYFKNYTPDVSLLPTFLPLNRLLFHVKAFHDRISPETQMYDIKYYALFKKK